MGAPKRNRKKFDKPKDIWNLARINADNALIKEYGLKNMSELWKVQSELSRIRGNVRLLLSGSAGMGNVEQALKARLVKLGIIDKDTPLEKLLELNEKMILDRRLESVVYRRGMARSMKQARQLITHGFISINGQKFTIPGYLVKAEEENKIGYYKNIEIAPVLKTETAEAAKETVEAEQAEN
ncbi:MAG: 30S ribosomal protein S4 [Candidatus Marsarchaeota archaeon]|nr:30S ribosomal protein S4 [Candidatus Marsarchaeota archaeon]